MKVGDIITREQVNALPVGSVARLTDRHHSDFDSIVRVLDGDSEFRIAWLEQSSSLARYSSVLVGEEWELLYLPVTPLKVGDVVTTEEQAKALPLGTVVIDDGEDEGSPEGAPAIKVEDDRWMFRNTFYGQADYADNEAVIGHRVIHIPARADTGAVRTAA